MEQGLVHTDITGFAQDSTGLIWIGTTGGLQSYDGYSFKFYDYYNTDETTIRYSHNQITSLCSDGDRLWVGTRQGLTTFDYKHRQFVTPKYCSETKEIDNTQILKTIIGPSHTLLALIPGDFKIATITKDYQLSGIEIPKSWDQKVFIHDIAADSLAIWACTTTKLFRLKIKQNKVIITDTYLCKNLTWEKQYFNSILVKDQFLYLRTGKGVVKYPLDSKGNIKKENCSKYDFHKLNNSIPPKTTGTFLVDQHHTLWCVSLIGLLEVSTDLSSPHTCIHRNSPLPYSLTSIAFSNIFIDDFDNLWIGTRGHGVNYTSLKPPLFSTVCPYPDSIQTIKGSYVKGIDKAKDGTLWVLTRDGGLNHYNKEKELIECTTLNRVTRKGEVFKTLKIDRKRNIIYIGLINKLISYDPSNHKSKILMSNQPGPYPHAQFDVSDIEIDHEDNLWISTWDKGILVLTNKSNYKQIIRYNENNHSLLSDCVSQIYYDQEKNELFAGTQQGLSRILLEGSQSQETRHIAYKIDKQKGQQSLSSNFISSIDKQNDSIYWVGTFSGGIDQITIHSDQDNDYTAKVYERVNGLPSNESEIVMLDNDGNVWIGGYGISRLDPKTGLIFSFDELDGLQSNYFKFGTGYKDREGIIYMGGIDGFNYFDPRNVNIGTEKYKLAITDLLIHGKSYESLPKDEIGINYRSTLTLNNNQNDFALVFSTLGYRLSNRIYYRYKLLGYQDEWRKLTVKHNKVYFANLDYGSYTFILQYSTDNGHTWEQQEKRILIDILPPWWLSMWAKTIYFLLICAIVYFTYHIHIDELKMRHQISLHQLELQKEEENHQMKLQFFMNISHEFKTPLTLILSSLETIQDKIKHSDIHEQIASSIDMINRNSNQLLHLITELVDFRKSDLRMTKMHVQETDFSHLASRIVNEFQTWAAHKSITLTNHIRSNITLTCDKKQVSMILSNLISNAIKYTANNGEINIEITTGILEDIKPRYGNQHQEGKLNNNIPLCIIKINDNGIGINNEVLPHIYERFFQSQETSEKQLGTGIGLAIAKNFILLHHGVIIVSSHHHEGTEFIIALPLIQDSHQTADKKATFSIEDYLKQIHVEYNYQSEQLSSKEDKNAVDENDDKPTLLIVEDNIELLHILKEQFSYRYHVLTAIDGEQGLSLCLSHYPDTVISDIMMPKMNGVDLCKAIRENLSTAYIPIILLTAKSSIKDQIEGYESGADLYLPKPFSMKLLVVNVERLLSQKKMILKLESPNQLKKQTTSSKEILEVSESEPTRNDFKNEKENQFIEELTQYLKSHLYDSELSVQELCEELAIGRTSLYTIVKRISGQSLGEYIRTMRLEKAAHLLKHTDKNITEVMYDTGFVSISHFSRIFKKKYGIPPSEYAKEENTRH